MQWKEIKNWPGYSISDEGQVRNDKTGTLRVASLTSDGYLNLTIEQDGVAKCKTIHRLVMEAFCPTENPALQVNHKDGDRTNNRLDNLEWVTREQNLAARDMSRVAETLKKQVLVKYVDGHEEVYPSLRECARRLGINHTTIAHYIGHKLSPRRKIQAEFYYLT